MDTYERLQEILDAHPSGAPKSAAFDEILRILFTPEEAALAVHMSFAFRAVGRPGPKGRPHREGGGSAPGRHGR